MRPTRAFRRLVDALDASTRRRTVPAPSDRNSSQQLVPPAQRRLADLEAKAARAVDLARKQGAEDYILDANHDALQKLSWLYLKLLLGRQYLSSQESQATEQVLLGSITSLQKELAGDDLAPTLRESKAETLKILQKRHENLERREQTLAEIDSDLTRIEAQIDLAVENATMSGQAQAVSSNITLVSHLLDPGSLRPLRIGDCRPRPDVPENAAGEGVGMTMSAASVPAASAACPPLPDWAADLVTQYESNAASQFILHGNVNDRLVLPLRASRSWARFRISCSACCCRGSTWSSATTWATASASRRGTICSPSGRCSRRCRSSRARPGRRSRR